MKAHRIISPRADWLAILDALTTPETDPVRWADGVIDAATPVFPNGQVGLYELTYAPDLTDAAIPLTRPSVLDVAMRELERFAKEFGAKGWAPFHLAAPVVTLQEAAKKIPANVETSLTDIHDRWAVRDGLSVIAHPAPGRVVVLHAVFDHRVDLTRYEREALMRLGLHLDATARLRHAPSRVIAELSSTGTILHREDDAPASATLQRAVTRVDEARRAGGPDRLALWSALVEGRASVVRRGRGKQTRYIVLENPPARHALHALTPTEVKVLELAARGHSMKLIGYGLGISGSMASARVGSAAARVGALSRTEVVRLAALLTHDARVHAPAAALSKAEQDIYTLLQDGLSNRDIALARSRSLRTVANQVASILRKTAAPSRRALLAR